MTDETARDRNANGETARTSVRHSAQPSSDKQNDDPLRELVEQCQRGSESAKHELYLSCQDMVFRLMIRMVGEQNAPDVFQQVFLKMFQKIDQFDGRSQFRTWLYRLAINEALQFLRRPQKGKGHAELVSDPEDKRPSGSRSHDASELLTKALELLDPELKSVFVMKEVDELSYDEIAESAGIPPGTVGSRLNRARRELRQILTELGWEI